MYHSQTSIWTSKPAIVSSVSAITEEVRYVGRIQKPLSVMVWAGVSAIRNITGFCLSGSEN